MKVYIASSYSVGDPEINVRRQIDAADELLELGYTPFVPLLAHFWHIVHKHNERRWLLWSLRWMLTCDVVLRLPGASIGADIECLVAEAADIPVFEGIERLRAWARQ